MSRWEPDARERLVRAAVELFDELGYADTTVVAVTQRAGLTKSTFFRHFQDKREVLFGGQDALNLLLTSGIANAPADATPLEAVGSGLDAATATFTAARREFAPALRAVIAANNDLREREALKHRGFADAMAEALRHRGVPDQVARVAAWLGVLAFVDAYDQWADPATAGELTDLARRALDRMRTALTSLD